MSERSWIGRDSLRYSASSRLALGIVFIIALTLLLPRAFGPPGMFDEGFIVSGAMMIRNGWLPIMDFFVIYGPGQYYLTAGLFGLFGEDLLVHRLLHTVTLALLGTCVAWCAFVMSNRRLEWLFGLGAAYLLIAVFARTGAGYPAVPAVLLLMCSAPVFAWWFTSGSDRALFVASLLLGLAGLLRWDFGVYGVFTLTVTLGVVCLIRKSGAERAMRWQACLLGPWFILTVLAFGPLIFMGDAQRWFEEVPKYAVFEFNKWRGIDFVRPQISSFVGAWGKRDLGTMANASAALAFAAAPLALAPAAALLAIARLRRTAAAGSSIDVYALVISLLSLCLMNQMRVRPTLTQGFAAVACCIPLAAYFGQFLPKLREASRWMNRFLPRVAGVGLVMLAIYGAQHKLRSLYGQRAALDLPKASYVVVPTDASSRAEWSAYANLVRHVRATTADGESIFSGVSDTSRLFVNDAMLYFLTDRPPATRWIEMEPGLTNTEKGQLEMVEALTRQRVNTVVLWNKVSDEPNATSRSNGVHILDDFVRANYIENRRFGEYTVFVRSPRSRLSER